MRLRNFFSRFRRAHAIAAITAICLVVILELGAVAIAMSYAYYEHHRVQMTAKTVALVAASELPNPSKATAMAVHYVKTRLFGEELDRREVLVGNWNPRTETWLPGVTPFNAVKVTMRPSTEKGNGLGHFLAQILSLLDMEASAVAYVQWPGRLFVVAS